MTPTAPFSQATLVPHCALQAVAHPRPERDLSHLWQLSAPLEQLAHVMQGFENYRVSSCLAFQIVSLLKHLKAKDAVSQAATKAVIMEIRTLSGK